jgi:hypothetical protein
MTLRLRLLSLSILLCGRAPEVYPIVFREAFTPLSLLRSCRKAVWRSLRENARGRTIQAGLRSLESELPKTLLSFLRFDYN